MQLSMPGRGSCAKGNTAISIKPSMGQTQIGLRFPAQQCLPLMADQQEKRRQTAVRLGNQKQPQ